MLDIRWIRENKELTEKRLASRRGGDEAKVGRLLELDTQRRTLLTEV
ncbi:MAG: serine--tRNA ligase, partial [Verrucomicrobia bacterium]|nr:serine--tRNA ligase [Verrucomicrobiota bacterium]